MPWSEASLSNYKRNLGGREVHDRVYREGVGVVEELREA